MIRMVFCQLAASTSLAFASAAISAPPANRPAVVIVHGAYADAAGWERVIPILQRDGYTVTAVENPLESLQGDVDNTKRVLGAQNGPVVLVGHSYGGAVITEAATGNPNVKALVYIAAIAPEAGEAVGALLEKYPSDLGNALVVDSGGYVTVDRTKFHQVFAADLPAEMAAVMAATQKPIKGEAFNATIRQPAWKSIPSWFLVSTEDRALNPDLERFYAKRMSAHTREINASHVAFISHPKEVAQLIEEAAVRAGQ